MIQHHWVNSHLTADDCTCENTALKATLQYKYGVNDLFRSSGGSFKYSRDGAVIKGWTEPVAPTHLADIA